MAEGVATDWLINQGYKIVVRNWRNRFAEIDIIAKKRKQIIFVEVKYRRNLYQGDGFTYITPAKLTQMTKAAKLYLLEFPDDKLSPSLSVVAITGDNFEELIFVNDIHID